MMRSRCLFAVLVLLLPLLAAAADRRVLLAGGWKPITNISDPHVKEIAEFAVSEYKKQAQKKLVFQTVVRGESQVVAGTNYRLVITVKDESSSPVNYEAVVWEKPWEHFRKLVSFTKLKN